MEHGFPFFAVIAGVGLIMLAVLFGWLDRKKLPSKTSIRRGTGNAMLGLQQFIEPSVENVFQAQNVEQKEEEDDQGLGDGDEATIRSDLAQALGQAPIDTEEVRRHLAAAARIGLDWRTFFDQAVADELRERPFRGFDATGKAGRAEGVTTSHVVAVRAEQILRHGSASVSCRHAFSLKYCRRRFVRGPKSVVHNCSPPPSARHEVLVL